MTVAVARRPPQRLADLLARKSAWAILAVVVVGVLAFGSVHPPASPNGARADYLDSIIKLPACDDISIAQSDIVQARELRAKVAQLVDAGHSNAAIEAYVIGHFGSDEIL